LPPVLRVDGSRETTGEAADEAEEEEREVEDEEEVEEVEPESLPTHTKR
jgi:hypothetical protein